MHRERTYGEVMSRSPRPFTTSTRARRGVVTAALAAATLLGAGACSAASDTAGAAAGAAASAGASAASSAGSDAYCAALRNATTSWSDAGASLADSGTAAKFVETVKSIEAVAPEQVKQQWASLEQVYEKFTSGNRDLTALTGELSTLRQNAQTIEEHAKSTCQVDLAGGSGAGG